MKLEQYKFDTEDEEQENKKLECQNCGYVWTYTGNAEYYACCPRCSYKVNIDNQEIPTTDGRRTDK